MTWTVTLVKGYFLSNGTNDAEVLNGVQISINAQLPVPWYPSPSYVVMVDREFGNMMVEFNGRETVKSFEGEAFVTVGVDEEGKVSYIAIEPIDEDLREGIKRVRDE